MAIAFDAATTDGTAAGVPQTSRTFSHTCTGTDRMLLVKVSCDQDGTTNALVSSVTYNGVALTERITAEKDNSIRAAIWYLVAPSSGANNVVVTISVSQEFIVVAESWTNVNQTTPLGTAASANGTSTAPTVDVSSATSEVVTDLVSANRTVAYTIGGGQTQRWAKTASAAIIVVDARGSSETGAATTTMSWTISTSEAWVICAVPIKSSATPGSGAVTFTGGGDLTLGAALIGPDYDFQVAINF